MSRLDILYSGLSSAVGTELITPEKARARGIDLTAKVVSIDRVFEHTYYPTSTPLHVEVLYDDERSLIDIKVKTLIGMIIEVKVHPDFTISEVKEAIESADRTLPANRQKLVFNSIQLSDADTVRSLGINDGDTIYLVLILRGGGLPLVLDDNFLDVRYDYDFTKVDDGNTKYWRGTYEGKALPYHRPCGWYRHAIKVLNKYGDDNTWLGGRGVRTESTTGEWPVSYHGTKKEKASGILSEGFRAGPRQRFASTHGVGVYSSPCLGFVERDYATPFCGEDGNNYKLVFQNRVNTKKGHLGIQKGANTYNGQPVDYWISKNDDIRPYGILIKKL